MTPPARYNYPDMLSRLLALLGLLALALAAFSCVLPPAAPPPGQPTTAPATSPSTPALPSPAPGPAIPPQPPPAPEVPTAPTDYTYQMVNVYPHDPSAFTQGLVFDGGLLYEGTGLLGQSSVRRVALESGEVLIEHRLDAQYFGEGIAVFGDRLIQLTWQNRVGFVYEKDTLQKAGDFTYATEGWGITHDGRRLIMSDGTSTLYFLDPYTFKVTGKVGVTDEGAPVAQLNELEFINGKVYANVWPTNRIVIIDPGTGRVTARVDLTGLLQTRPVARQVDVLNGIAYDPVKDRLFVTGKWWPWLFEIKLISNPP